VVGDRRVETNASGQAVVTVDGDRVVTARYDPAPWYALGIDQWPYTEARATSRPRPGLGAIATLAGMYGQFVVGLVAPVLLVLWLAHSALGAATWPPWEVFRE